MMMIKKTTNWPYVILHILSALTSSMIGYKLHYLHLTTMRPADSCVYCCGQQLLTCIGQEAFDNKWV